MNSKSRVAPLVALLVFGIAAIVYLLTLTPTVPFWDSGEFIAVSNILGIPHPPGTPFVVILCRLATLIPWKSVAERVNAVSAISSALALMMTYFITLKLVRRAQGGERQAWHEGVAIAAAAIAALLLAFSDNWWENSIEAEVYSMMSLATALVFWFGLKWWELRDSKPSVLPLMLASYVLWLSSGLHPAVAPTALPLWGLLAIVDFKVAMLFAMPILSMLGVTTGLEHMAGWVLVLGTAQVIYYASQRKVPGWALAVNLVGAAIGMYYALSPTSFTTFGMLAALAALIVPFAAMAPRHREGRILLIVLLLMVAGYSSQAYLPIRSAHHPAINEGAPATWEKLRDLLERKQYGEMNMFVRRAPLSVQLNKEFWRYFSRQWPIIPNGRAPWSALIPLLLGLAGAVWQARKEQRGFIYLFLLFGLNTAGLITYLNFSDHEVRDRDYFFQTGYHAFAIWIGFGIAWLVGWIRESFGGESTRRWVTVGATALLGLQPFLLMHNLWFVHDRSRNFVARDYAYDMLAPLKPHSFIFTNGDNDTFPLWYIQQVEGFRKDVRIVNLSLLNTDWYIRQLRDEEPKVPIDLDDRTIDGLGQGAVQDAQGRIIYTNEFMVHHIMEQARNKDGTWKMQPYFAVTVPEHYGYDPYFALGGLVYEVKRDSAQAGMDVAATRKALYETFKYRGLFTADGSWDTTVYKDENAETLSRNYAAAHLQLALHYRRSGNLKGGITEMERVARMFPNYVEVQLPLGQFYLEAGDTTKALNVFSGLVQKDPGNPELRYYHGAALGLKGQVDAAVAEFDAAIRLDPQYAQPYYSAYYALRTSGQRERALQYLQRWVDQNPNDTQAGAMLQSEKAALGMNRVPGALGR